MDNAPVTQNYRIPADNLPALKERVEKLNKKVAKLIKKGFAAQPVVLEVDPTPEIERNVIVGQREDGEYIRRDKIFFKVTMTATPIKAAGWEFVATLQHEEGGTIIHAVPGAVKEGELARYRDCKPGCEHCGYDRRRNDTFILRKVAVNG